MIICDHCGKSKMGQAQHYRVTIVQVYEVDPRHVGEIDLCTACHDEFLRELAEFKNLTRSVSDV